jgi:hypothetical protein
MTTGTRIIATYTMENGFPQIMEEELSLPFSLFCQRSSPSKSATHKITLETNKPAVNILSLFVGECHACKMVRLVGCECARRM